MSDENTGSVPDATGDEMGDVLGGDVSGPMRSLMEKMVRAHTKPHREAHEAEVSSRRENEAREKEAWISSSAKTHASAWEKANGDMNPAVRKMMFKVATKVLPGEGATPAEHLDRLRLLAEREVGKAEPKKIEAPKPKRSLRGALTGVTEEMAMRRKPKDTSDDDDVSFDEALELAWGGK